MVLARLIQRQRNNKKNDKKNKPDDMQICEAMMGDVTLINRAKELLKLKS